MEAWSSGWRPQIVELQWHFLFEDFIIIITRYKSAKKDEEEHGLRKLLQSKRLRRHASTVPLEWELVPESFRKATLIRKQHLYVQKSFFRSI